MGIRVLVAADEDSVRGEVFQALEGEGFEVAEATTTEQALELFRRDPFPLVITDINMPRISGLDLLKEVKSRDGEAMVVVMANQTSPERATEALRAGADDYLIKPFEDAGMIAAVVHRAVDRYELNARNRTLMQDLKRNAEELERLTTRLTDMANRDGLTGLYNHRYFRESLDQELSRSRRHDRRFAVIFMDVDHFKHYNDTHGHLAGDSLLRTVARLLQERSRGETLAARYGGDEFVLLVPETDLDGAGRYAEIVRDLIGRHPFVGRETQPLGRVTLSLGVSGYPEGGDDPSTLIDHADKALYLSKDRGRDRVSVWDPSLV